MPYKSEILEKLVEAIVNLASDEDVRFYVEESLDKGANPLEIIEALRRGLEIVGARYEKGEYFLMELILAGNLAKEVTALIQPLLVGKEQPSKGKVVIGTVQGDLHDIGKNIVAVMLRSAGFNVLDLGIDVPAEKFVEAVKKEKPDIVALSTLLSIGVPQVEEVIKTLERAGLRSKVKVMIGGRPITKSFSDEVGADAYRRDAIEAVRLAEALLQR